MERLDSPRGCWTLIEEPVEDAARDPDRALVGSEGHREHDGSDASSHRASSGNWKTACLDLFKEENARYLFYPGECPARAGPLSVQAYKES